MKQKCDITKWPLFVALTWEKNGTFNLRLSPQKLQTLIGWTLQLSMKPQLERRGFSVIFYCLNPSSLHCSHRTCRLYLSLWRGQRSACAQWGRLERRPRPAESQLQFVFSLLTFSSSHLAPFFTEPVWSSGRGKCGPLLLFVTAEVYERWLKSMHK